MGTVIKVDWIFECIHQEKIVDWWDHRIYPVTSSPLGSGVHERQLIQRAIEAAPPRKTAAAIASEIHHAVGQVCMRCRRKEY